MIKMTGRKLTRAEAVKEFFGSGGKAVTNSEIGEFIRTDKVGFREIADDALVELGAELKEAK